MSFWKMAEELSAELEVSRETFYEATRIAIEEAFLEVSGIQECDVDLESKTLTAVFRVPEDVSYDKAVEVDPDVAPRDLIIVNYDLEDMPQKVVKEFKMRFREVLFDLHATEVYMKAKRLTRKVLRGVIDEAGKNYFEVILPEEEIIALFPRRYWVKKEIRRYRKGVYLYFYVLYVKKEGASVEVILSRRSKGLPEGYLKNLFPSHIFRCVFRRPGERSLVLTDMNTRDRSLREERKRLEWELNEVVKLRPI